MTLILDGKYASQTLLSRQKIPPTNSPQIVFILIGNHPASLSYITIKQKACQQQAIRSHVVRLEEHTSLKHLIEEIKKLNDDPQVDGILVQLPLPAHIPLQPVIEAIDPKKDVDCLHPFNLGRLTLGDTTGLLPCTPSGILELLNFYEIDAYRKEICILGRSSIVGRPLSILVSLKSTLDATVTLCHQGTKNLFEYTKKADILVAAMGKPHFIKKEHIKEGAVVIDVGINREGDRLVGDIDFSSVKQKAKAITPVPGGVGPMTVYALLQNALKAHKQRIENS